MRHPHLTNPPLSYCGLGPRQPHDAEEDNQLKNKWHLAVSLSPASFSGPCTHLPFSSPVCPLSFSSFHTLLLNLSQPVSHSALVYPLPTLPALILFLTSHFSYFLTLPLLSGFQLTVSCLCFPIPLSHRAWPVPSSASASRQLSSLVPHSCLVSLAVSCWKYSSDREQFEHLLRNCGAGAASPTLPLKG